MEGDAGRGAFGRRGLRGFLKLYYVYLETYSLIFFMKYRILVINEASQNNFVEISLHPVITTRTEVNKS
jgi:hypothetical protein